MAGQLIFLGQLGCLLPAGEAAFSPRDRLLTLFAAGESETGEDSRMGLEVQRLGLLQAQMTKRSIFFFNEPMTSTSASEGGQICVDLLADLAGKGVPSLLVTHFNHIWPQLRSRFEEMGLAGSLQSLVMTSEEADGGIRYLYKLKEAPPPPSSHARAVVAAKGVTLEAMVAGLRARGLDMRADDPGWDKIRRGVV
jgi:DNA mismatch repair ATPase MutS